MASPGPFWFLPQNILGVSLYWWLHLTGVLNAPTQARVSRWMRASGDAIIGRDRVHRVGSGHIRHLPHRVMDAHGNGVTLEDGTRVAVSAVVWCTGFRPHYRWLRVPGALDVDGAPIHTGGASPVPGLHWMGLPWQTRVNSWLVNGIARDARATVERATR